ncbi:conserved hypothetical protein, partial [Ricinus communis]
LEAARGPRGRLRGRAGGDAGAAVRLVARHFAVGRAGAGHRPAVVLPGLHLHLQPRLRPRVRLARVGTGLGYNRRHTVTGAVMKLNPFAFAVLALALGAAHAE